MNRKILKTTITLMIAAMILPSVALSRVSENPYDVNHDGKVNSKDVYLVWTHIENHEPYREDYDVNFDGIVNFQDCGLIYRNKDDPDENMAPEVENITPADGATDVARPPVLSLGITDYEWDPLNVTIVIFKPSGGSETLLNVVGGVNGQYECEVPDVNDFIYGSTEYRWAVIIYDGTNGIILELTFTTGGSRYDVDNDDDVDFTDVLTVLRNRQPYAPYDGLYDVNDDGIVDYEDAKLVWYNRD